MIFEETTLAGAFLVRGERILDERGTFERLWCSTEFGDRGLAGRFTQTNLSTNRKKATLRGLHYQLAPRAEDKLVSCLRGRIFDVIIDLRASSSSYSKWYGVELADTMPLALYVPKGFAHGFVTLEDDSWILYHMSEQYVPELAAGIRWDDPTLAITWPVEPLVISARDCALPKFETAFV